jgi:uncharacterized membrane protein SpoIIM required for sporulation
MNNKKYIGLGILVLAVIGFFVSFGYLGLQGTVPEYRNPEYLLKLAFVYAFPIIGLFFGLRILANKKISYQISGGLTTLLVLGYVIGLLTH